MEKQSRIALVSGSNRGIGFSIVLELLKLEYTVIMTSRSIEAGKKSLDRINNPNVIYHQLDITSHESIQDLVEFVDLNFGRLDVLINNAGIIEEEDMRLPSSKVSEDVIKKTLDVNFFGAFRLTRAFLNLIKKSASGKIINVSARNGLPRTAFSGWIGYKISKASINAFTVDLAEELCETNVSVNAFHPGWVASDMGLRVKALLDENSEETSTPSPQPLDFGVNSLRYLLDPKNQNLNGKFVIDSQVVNW